MSTATETQTWTLDTVHSNASFAVKHMVVSTFRAEFERIEATLDTSGDEIKLTGRVPVESVILRDENLRGHLYSEEFFDVANTPNVDFVSTSVERGEGDSVTVRGDLTVKGITKPVVGTGVITQPTEDAFGGTRIGVELETTLDRTAYDLNWNAPLPKGGFALSNDVKLSIQLEFVAA
jgi:polyisoprenoid-binding protein YceI